MYIGGSGQVFAGRFAEYSGIRLHAIYYFISIIFHGVIQHVWCFFLEVPRIEEVQDSNSSPRREEVGRRTLRAFGGFLPTFFYQANFGLFTREILLFIDKLQKLDSRSL